MNGIVKMRDVRFDKDLFINFRTRTILDNLLCSYQGLPKGVNYMIIGDPGVGKTTIILDMLANIRKAQPSARILFISAEMNEIDLAIYVERFPKFGDLDILFIEGGFDEITNSSAPTSRAMTRLAHSVTAAPKLLCFIYMHLLCACIIAPLLSNVNNKFSIFDNLTASAGNVHTARFPAQCIFPATSTETLAIICGKIPA